MPDSTSVAGPGRSFRAAVTHCPCCDSVDEDLLDALADLLLGALPLPEDAAAVLNRHAWELYA